MTFLCKSVLRAARGGAAAAALLLAPAGQAAAQSAAQDPGAADQAPRFAPLPPPALNFYGSPGLLDMPSAEMLPDGQVAVSYSWFGGQSRYNLTFQALPWLSASFRYNGIQNLNLFGFDTYYDRGFDVRARLWREGRWRPEVTLGLQDFAGTGIYAAEYFAATKQFQTPPLGAGGQPGRLKVTAGLGWGRLGSQGAIGSIGGARPAFDASTRGGELSTDQWFRGDFAPFGGLEWQPSERWGFKAEYSSDAYVTETQDSDVFERKSSFSFGAEYQLSPGTRIGAYYMYGAELGLTAQIQLNPKHPRYPQRVPAPAPVVPRSQWATEAAHWSGDWAASRDGQRSIRDRLAEALKAEGLILESVALSATRAEVRYRNPRYRSDALALGRAARAMAASLPPSVETFRIVPVRSGLGLSATEIRRSDLEALEFDPQAADALWAAAGVRAAGPAPAAAIVSDELYPAFASSVSPYAQPAYFDPDQPFRLDAGLDFSASYAPAPGWRLAGTLRQRLAGNVKDGRAGNSQLPPVRTDQVEYAQFGTTLENLYASRFWQPGQNLYARASAGLFESMFGGISGEILWKPVNSRLGLGAEANYVVQREFDQRFSFRDYRTFTGHASAYLELGRGYQLQLDAGRYLAGDYGGTVSLARVFSNGWKVGGFFTLTNVSAEEFGEGSFDKGFSISIPLGWLVGQPTRNAYGLTIRPTQRDGGQKVIVPGRLYGQVRAAHLHSLSGQRARIWE